ncbi:MAG: heme-binding protein [Candidatus Thiodiazotropha sp. (ex Clathrolucina costata)]|nr:heme-binding protein [Candidatus Thiodiazotropha taylori]
MMFFFTSKTLTPDAALMVAKKALESCRASGFQVSVAVVDGGGNLQVVLRDNLAGVSSPDGAILKAKTSINFRSATTSLSEVVNSNIEASGIKQLPGILILGGGVTIQASGSMVGAVGVAGAPDGKSDEKCALDGIEAIQELLEFAD